MSMGNILMLAGILLVSLVFELVRRSHGRCSDPWHRSLFSVRRCPTCGAFAYDGDSPLEDAMWDLSSVESRGGDRPHAHTDRSISRPDCDSGTDSGSHTDWGSHSNATPETTCDVATTHESSGSWCGDGDGDGDCDFDF